ncbi:hypothetical protein H8B06_12950 [Sphingobacterium sp. DN00404]|uniref:Tetratricopeptide repeat protein n=1 Tax=Sphingobacterium micropteri TaxID=2763501 RepID=A0ABR7YR04_9SPHI|nr:hypothetical protein [Sphingobacterium micropteri]MBD1433740.1 hypothetical protein [Sphingobacterium micropteri]
MNPREYIEKALDLQFGDDQQKVSAKQLYQQAIQACRSEDDNFEHLYAHYELMRMHADEDTEQAAAYARKCLKILDSAIQSGAIMHFSEQGQFQEEVIRYATNSIAWHTCLKTDNRQDLQEALELLSLGENYVDAPEHSYLLDTKVRLLLKLDRKEEAYQITRSCLINDPYVTYFDDILADDDYQQWKKEFERGQHVVFNDEEKQFLQKAEAISHKIREGLAEAQASRENRAEHVPAKNVIGRVDATEKYGLPDYLPADSTYLLFLGDLHVQGPLTMEWVFRQADELEGPKNIYGIIVDGDLLVNGDILDENYLHLYVLGNLQCDYFHSYNGQQIIKGDAHIHHGIYGQYNDGQLDIYGKLHTPYILVDDHNMPSSAEGNFVHMQVSDHASRYEVTVGIHPNKEWPWIWEYFEDSQKLFAPDFWTEQDTFSVDRFLAYIKKGKNPFVSPTDKQLKQQ